MYNGKYARRSGKNRRGSKRTGAVVLSLLLLLTFSIGGTLAYLSMNTDPVENVFRPSHVDNDVVEEFSGSVKNKVKIKNTGNIDAYIRATVIAYWAVPSVDKNGETVYLPYGGQVPVEDEDYTISWTMDGWTRGTDGYYYYQSAVAAGGVTGELFTGCEPVAEKVPEGCTLVVEVLGQSIQAKPTTAVQQAWGFVPGA